MPGPRASTAAIIAVVIAAAACAGISDEEFASRYGIEEPTDPARPLPPADLDTDGPAPRAEPIECPFDTSTLTDVECGEIEMPGRGADPDFEVTITYARFFAQGPADGIRPDPVIYLHGGPGSSILAEVPFWYESVAAPHLDARDVIFYDQRGAGFSSPLPTCHEVSDVADAVYGDAVDHDDLEAPFLDAMRDCARKFEERTEVDLTAFNSRVHSADLADLRRALGVDRYNIHGSSYGTRLAQTVMRDDPEGVRALVLSGIYPIDANLTGSVPLSMESSLDALFAACGADPICDEALPDPWGTLEDLVADLDRAPMEITVPDTVTTEYRLVLDGTDLLTALHQHLYTGFDAATIPDLLIDHLDGDDRRIERLAEYSIYDLSDVAAFLAVQCAEEAPFTTEDEIDRSPRHDFLRAVDEAPSLTGRQLLTVCETWGAAASDPIQNQAVTWDAPTLLLSGALDPITPAPWGSALAARLRNARHVVSNTLAHDSDEGLCITGMIAAFVDRPDGPVDSTCTAWDEHLPLDNKARRFTDPTAPPLTEVELEIGDDLVAVTVPEWFAEYDGRTHLRWRILDSFDPTLLVIGSGDDADADLSEFISLRGSTRFVKDPGVDGPAPPPGWQRAVLVTSGVDIIRYRHAAAGVQVAIVVENGEEAALERAVLLPAIESIEAGR